MAVGLQGICQADIVLAETGIAGPIRGRSPKPLGSTCFAMCTPTGVIVDEQCFEGDRETIQAKITEHALDMMVQYLTQS
jgi:nicotinamide mononucleotide (NMN) deamidase PncC